MAVHAPHPPGFKHQFEDMEQQREAGSLGMWVFLVTEIMFFGGLFATYIIYRTLYLTAFEEGSRLLNVKFGAANTAVLIGSSLTMALAIHAAQAGKKKSEQVMYLVLTMILGALFLFLKFNYEWRADYHEHLIPGFGFIIRPEWGAAGTHVPLYFCFYFFMTGLHAMHILGTLTVMAHRGRFSSEYYAPLEVSGLYWHFVDIVWIFLFPLLYLIGGRFALPGVH
jgi:cytochrome c oxidase subunit 3